MQNLECMKIEVAHIKINGFRGIDEMTLSDIGRVNILCGKNNSGKTTILQAINLHGVKKLSEIGLTVRIQNKDDLKELIAFYAKNPSDGHFVDTNFKNLEPILLKHFYNYLKTTDFEIRRNGLREFRMGFSDFLAENRITFDAGLNKTFNPFIETIFKLITVRIIDTPRKIESSASFTSPQKKQLFGTHLINYLFSLKNKPKSSEQNNLYQKVQKEFKEITFGFEFDVNLDENVIDLEFLDRLGVWRKSGECGLGLYQVLFIVSNILLSNETICLIEEPENSLHPSLQRKLFEFIYKSKNNQHIFITTHSNIFLDVNYADKIYQVKNSMFIEISDDTSKATLLQDLGYSVADNLIADLIILSEGPSDIPVLETFLKQMKLYENHIIKIWALGGDIMSYQDISVFTDTYDVIAIIDNDPKSSKIRKQFVNKCSKLGVHLHKLERYSIENYFSIKALKTVFVNQIPESLKSIEPNIKLEKQIGLDCKKNNRKIAREMTLDDIRGTDLMEFLEKIKSKLGE